MSIILPAIINSGMVLEKKSRIWGYCEDKKEIEIKFMDKKYIVSVENGRWETWIISDCFGGPYEMIIDDIILTDIYVGYVFFMGGQSNMELPISRVRIKYEDELQNINNTQIRAFYVKKELNFQASKELFDGEWKYACDDYIDDFFAVPYFFARKLQDTLNIPIGLINCAAGGSRIEAWMKEDSLREFKDIMEMHKLSKKDGYFEEITDADNNRVQKWKNELDENDIGLKEKYYLPNYDYSKWDKMALTHTWQNNIGNGSIWLKKSFYISKENASKPARLFLGRIIDADFTYINGQQIGNTEYQYPPRIYNIPNDLLHEGLNDITIRVISEYSTGGFIKDKDYKIIIDDDTIDLDVEWSYKIGCEMPPLIPPTFFYNYPCGLYNSMLYPTLPYTISAFLWYQGESNMWAAHNYYALLKIFLQDIRKQHKDDLPFIAVQLPNFDNGEHNDKWEMIQKEQVRILENENTALIITNDIGEYNDLHPLNKKDVGERMATAVCNLLFDMPINTDKVITNKQAKINKTN